MRPNKNKRIEAKGGRLRVATVFDLDNEPSKAQQQYKEQCDVNNIIAKYKKTGEWIHVTRKEGVYADVSNIRDYHESLQKVVDANNAFSTLPAHIRIRFDNDPAALLEFMQDPKNYDEGVKLGIFEKKQETQEPPTTTKPKTTTKEAPKTEPAKSEDSAE